MGEEGEVHNFVLESIKPHLLCHSPLCVMLGKLLIFSVKGGKLVVKDSV